MAYQILFYFLSLLTVFVSLTLAYFLKKHINLLHNYYQLKEKHRPLKPEVSSADVDREVNLARQQADQIVDQTLKLTEDVKTKLFAEIESVSKRYLDDEHQVVESALALMHEEVLIELKKQKTVLGSVIVEKQKQIEKELSDYKESEINKIKSRTNTILAEVVKTVLQKTLTQEDHEKIIIDALNNARKSNLL